MAKYLIAWLFRYVAFVLIFIVIHGLNPNIPVTEQSARLVFYLSLAIATLWTAADWFVKRAVSEEE